MFNRALIKPAAYRDQDYLSWIRQWPCFICARDIEVEAAHVGQHGLGTKASDLQTVSLCPLHHRGSYGLDKIGRERFEAKYNVDLMEQCLWLLNVYLTTGHALV